MHGTTCVSSEMTDSGTSSGPVPLSILCLAMADTECYIRWSNDEYTRAEHDCGTMAG